MPQWLWVARDRLRNWWRWHRPGAQFELGKAAGWSQAEDDISLLLDTILRMARERGELSKPAVKNTPPGGGKLTAECDTRFDSGELSHGGVSFVPPGGGNETPGCDSEAS